jgi:hypothetical protein
VSHNSWITITAGANDTGSGSVIYRVSANSSASPRTGTMTIAGVTFTVTQLGTSCTVTILPTSANVGAGASGGTVTVAAVREDFESGYRRITRLVEGLSPEQVLKAGHFSWTGRNPLATYIGPNTASHYRFAIKVLKRWLKGGVRGVAPA